MLIIPLVGRSAEGPLDFWNIYSSYKPGNQKPRIIITKIDAYHVPKNYLKTIFQMRVILDKYINLSSLYMLYLAHSLILLGT